LGISLLSLEDFIGNIIIMPGGFHWEYHYYLWALSLGVSLLSLGAFIRNFIIIPGGFHWEYHYYPWGFHWEYHYYPWGFHWEYHYYPWALSLRFSLLYPGNFIVIFIYVPGEFHYYMMHSNYRPCHQSCLSGRV